MASASVFKEIVHGLEVAYEKPPMPAEQLKIWWEDLGHFSDQDLACMARAHRRDPERGRFFPKTADLLAKAPAGAKHMPADLAWSLALQSLDETITIVWTAEIMQARAAALPIWQSGDRIGARMAFKAAYDAILAGPEFKPPVYTLSLGTRPQGRLDAIKQAQEMGLISAQQSQRLLPNATPEMPQVMNLLSSNIVDIQHHKEKIAEWKRVMASLDHMQEKQRVAILEHRQEQRQDQKAKQEAVFAKAEEIAKRWEKADKELPMLPLHTAAATSAKQL